MIKLTKIFSLSSEMNNKYKNHLMAKAMMSIMYSDKLPTAKRNEIFNQRFRIYQESRYYY